MKPPRFPRILLSLITHARDRQAILGDMDEVFRDKSEVSARGAKRWYWQQVAKSLPHLLWRRLTSSDAKNITAILCVTFIGYIFLSFWDIILTRRAAQFLARTFEQLPLESVRVFYFLVLAVGAAIAGYFMAAILFVRNWSFGRNAALFLGPIVAVILADSLIRFWLASSPKSPSYFAMRFGLSSIAFIIGAYLGSKPQKFKNKP